MKLRGEALGGEGKKVLERVEVEEEKNRALEALRRAEAEEEAVAIYMAAVSGDDDHAFIDDKGFG